MFKKKIHLVTGNDEEICVIKLPRKEYNTLVNAALSEYIEKVLTAALDIAEAKEEP